MRRKDVYEVFDLFAKAKTKADKVKILQDNDSPALRDVCRGSLDKTIIWLLPKGKVPYEPSTEYSAPATLLKQNRKFAYLIKGGIGPDIIPAKREAIFISILEGIHPRDAELLVSMINKKAPVKGLTRNVVSEAFPGLLKDTK